MLKRIIDTLKRLDWLLMIAMFFLITFGLLAIYSVDLSKSADLTNFKKQVWFAGIGFVLFFLFSFINYKNLYSTAKYLYWGCMGLLVAVLFLGSTIRGSRAWFQLLGFNFQPAEAAKIILIIWLAKFLAAHARELQLWRYLIASAIFAGIPIFLIIIQPDFGSAMILAALWLILVLVAGLKKSHVFSLVGVITVIFIVSFLFVFKDYQKQRIMTFFNPNRDPLGSGYNVTQSIIAVGSGQFTGKGMALGSQSQLKFLPEAQTDFIFAVIAEEWGFLGIGAVFILWALMFYRLAKHAVSCHDNFGLFLILGILIILFSQSAVNMGMNLGMAPVTGVSLPFIGYGGSSLIASMIMIGIAESVIARS